VFRTGWLDHASRFQVAQTAEQGHFDLALGRDQPIERAIPGLELSAVDAHAAVPVPPWHEWTTA
jgi:hypothetical protein